jgi:hypothetical protein
LKKQRLFMALNNVYSLIKKARRYHAAGIPKYALQDLKAAEAAYEKVADNLSEKLQELRDGSAEALALGAYDYSSAVERAIKIGVELQALRREITK